VDEESVSPSDVDEVSASSSGGVVVSPPSSAGGSSSPVPLPSSVVPPSVPPPSVPHHHWFDIIISVRPIAISFVSVLIIGFSSGSVLVRVQLLRL
jgi:hypothetical protein